MDRIVAIHQPNFFPWLGYFDKINQSDIFIFLDDVDYPRSGSGSMGSWLNRVRLNIQGKEHWVGCPVKRLPLGTSISLAQIDDQQPWRVKLLRTLQTNYRSARHFERTMELLSPLIEAREDNLARFNMLAVKTIASFLGLSTEFILQSQLPSSGESTERLISLVKAAGGNTYLSGGGAGGYQVDDLFSANGLKLLEQGFKPTPYGPPEKFIPGLSVIDYLMHDARPLSEAFKEEAAG